MTRGQRRHRHPVHPLRFILIALAGSLVLTAGLFSLRAATPPLERALGSQEASSAGGVAPQQIALPPHQAAPRAPGVRLQLSTVQGLGDSVPAGSACDCSSYVVQLAHALSNREGRAVSAVNSAQDSETSDGLLSEVTQDEIRATPDRVSVITIGANDFDPGTLSDADCTAPSGLACYRPVLATLQANIDGLLKTLVTGQGAHGPIVITGYWNVFLDGDVGAARGPNYVRDSDALTRAINTVLQTEAKRYGITYLDLYTPFKQHDGGNVTALLAADGDHPSAAGHALITKLLLKSLLSASG